MFFCLDRFYEYIESIKIYKKPAKYTTHYYENHLHLCMIQYCYCKSAPDPREPTDRITVIPIRPRVFMCGRSMQSHVLRDTTWSHVGKPEP